MNDTNEISEKVLKSLTMQIMTDYRNVEFTEINEESV